MQSDWLRQPVQESLNAFESMADYKFSCPHCGQHLQAESGYEGMQISCPSCQGSMVVPGEPSVPNLAATSASRPSTISSPPPPTSSRPAPSAPTQAGASGCPSCGAALPRGAVLCTHCGYNLVTRQRTVAGRPAALGKPADAHRDAPWYKTAYPYIAAVLVIMGILYFFGRENPPVRMAFVGVALLYVVTVHIIVVVAAFQESVGTGFLTLCIPFFALYFVFKTCESDTLKILYGVAILINIALKFIKFE